MRVAPPVVLSEEQREQLGKLSRGRYTAARVQDCGSLASSLSPEGDRWYREGRPPARKAEAACRRGRSGGGSQDHAREACEGNALEQSELGQGDGVECEHHPPDLEAPWFEAPLGPDFQAQ